ncbi:MAG TPA: SDR family oxidoreductase [Methylomirabilota bacterium]|jgi:3-oxoacyl-[acyl-carrier protein] reductase|nr:SDR family oxidoreductase [Methylomirabilota bacterium]
MDLGIKGKTALVVAASKGMGRASALGLAAEGARVVMCARGEAALEDAAAEVKRQTGAEVLALVADASRAADISRVVAEANRAFGGVDILVANVGGPPPGPFEAMTDEQWKTAFEQVHLSAVRFIREVLPHMKQARWGRILAIQSSSVKQPVDGLVLSNGIRPGIAGLFKTLAGDLAPHGITVNLVLPGRIMTDRFREHQTDRATRSGVTLEKQMELSSADIPMGRIGTPEEFAAMVVFLASARASYVTGTAVQVDGGLIRSVV